GVGQERRHHRVTRLMVGTGDALVLAHRHRLALDTHQHLVACASRYRLTTVERPARAAMSAASFTRFARSAPEKPGVPRAVERRSTSGSSATFRVSTRRIC